jgi:hypothetical protein
MIYQIEGFPLVMSISFQDLEDLQLEFPSSFDEDCKAKDRLAFRFNISFLLILQFQIVITCDQRNDPLLVA